MLTITFTVKMHNHLFISFYSIRFRLFFLYFLSNQTFYWLKQKFCFKVLQWPLFSCFFLLFLSFFLGPNAVLYDFHFDNLLSFFVIVFVHGRHSIFHLNLNLNFAEKCSLLKNCSLLVKWRQFLCSTFKYIEYLLCICAQQ